MIWYKHNEYHWASLKIWQNTYYSQENCNKTWHSSSIPPWDGWACWRRRLSREVPTEWRHNAAYPERAWRDRGQRRQWRYIVDRLCLLRHTDQSLSRSRRVVDGLLPSWGRISNSRRWGFQLGMRKNMMSFRLRSPIGVFVLQKCLLFCINSLKETIKG